MADTPDVKDDTGRRRRVREISGPGAADFLTAPGGLDRPESSADKGTGAASDEDRYPARDLVPDLDDPGPDAERTRES